MNEVKIPVIKNEDRFNRLKYKKPPNSKSFLFNSDPSASLRSHLPLKKGRNRKGLLVRRKPDDLIALRSDLDLNNFLAAGIQRHQCALI